MKNILLIVSLSFFLNTNALATNENLSLSRTGFIAQNTTCVYTKTSCQGGSGTCIKESCGNQVLDLDKERVQKLHIEKNKIREPQLKKFVIKHNLKGRRFSQLIELEAYMKTNLPPDLRTMKIDFSYERIDRTDYNPNRIIVLLNANSYILDLIIG